MSFKLGMPRITLNPLQTIDDEEAKTIVENEKLILIPDKTNKTGFWYIRKKEDLHRQRPYQILPIPEYGINRGLCFRSNIAAAVYISQHLGRSVCRSITTWYEDESKTQILTNIRIPNRFQIPKVEMNGQMYGGRNNSRTDTWRYKTGSLYDGSKRRTKIRNGETSERRAPSREHKFDWTRDYFGTWVADTLEEENFKCAYSSGRLTPKCVSLERLDETRGYSTENCVLIHIAFQTGHTQWSREKFMSVYNLRNTDTYDEHEVHKSRIYNSIPYNQHSIESKRGNTPPRLYAMLRKLKNNSIGHTKKRNAKGRNHRESEITIEYLIDIWEKQRGRCYYLDIPMNIDGDWRVSLERIDNGKGYTTDNVVLTTLETQNSHHTWSKEFVESVWN